MILRVYYNALAFDETVMIKINGSNKDVHRVETKNRVTCMYDAQEEIVAYNIHMRIETDHNGYQEMTPTLLEAINAILQEDVQRSVTHDFTNYFVIGQVKTCVSHPDSDHLHVCEVDVQDELLQIVCGASNVKEGIKVVVAKINAVMPNGLLIQPNKLRGVASSGMLCSAYELGLITDKKKGILIVEECIPVGKPFEKGEFQC